MSYQVGIDLGTTYTATAVFRGGEAVVVPLGNRSASVASVVFVGPDGSWVVGEGAERRVLTDPDRVVREFKRRVGDPAPVVVGGEPVGAAVVAARFVEWVLARVAEREGGAPERVAVAHPAEWGPHKREVLVSALSARGVADVVLVAEPAAAALGYAGGVRVEPGSVVGVYDLGGGTFDAAVVRRTVAGGFELLGRPQGLERLGGVDFDELVFEFVRSSVGAAWEGLDGSDPVVRSAVAGLRRECVAAKEALSADTEVTIPVMVPGVSSQVRLVRAEFEEMIRPYVVETVEALRRAVASAGVEPAELSAVLLVGGSSRIPLVAELVSAELGRPVAVDADPKTTVALGAAIAAHHGSAEAAATGADATDTAADAGTTAVLPVVALDDDGQRDRAAIAESARPSVEQAGPVLLEPSWWRSRARALALGAAASVIGVTALAGTVATQTGGTSPTAANEAVTAEPAPSSAAQPAVEMTDPWTGTSQTDTTPPGPQRPQARPTSTPQDPRAPRTTAPKPGPTPGAPATGGGDTGQAPVVPDNTVDEPPVEQPPVEQPPVEQPPAEQPPAEQPPAEEPPVEQPPADGTTGDATTTPVSGDGTATTP